MCNCCCCCWCCMNTAKGKKGPSTQLCTRIQAVVHPSLAMNTSKKETLIPTHLPCSNGFSFSDPPNSQNVNTLFYFVSSFLGLVFEKNFLFKKNKILPKIKWNTYWSHNPRSISHLWIYLPWKLRSRPLTTTRGRPRSLSFIFPNPPEDKNKK